MKWRFYDISIRTKLIIVILSVTLIALFASFSSYFIFTSTRDKQNLIHRVEITAKLIGEYAVSPLAFGDKEGGQEIIERINSLPEINAAFILTEENEIFAQYIGNEKADTIPRDFFPEPDEVSIWSNDAIHIKQPIIYRDDVYGFIYLIVSLSPLKEQLLNDVWVLLFTMLAIVVLSWLITLLIQQYISKPIKKLVRTTNEITEEGNYMLRVENQGTDEIGQLYKSYNNMLERIALEREQQLKYSKALEISELNYRSIFENSIVGIFKVEKDSGKIVQANNRIWEILHIKYDARKNYYIDDFLPKRVRAQFLRSINENGLIENLEINYKKNIWISFSGKELNNQNYIEGVIQDITDRKRNYLELKKVNFELDNFVYHASHDLRSPLRSILGLTNLLKIENPSDTAREVIDKIENSINRLDHLVTDLLTFSKNSRTKENIIEINFDELLKETLDAVPLEYTQDIALQKKVAVSDKFLGDKTRISVILNNLIVNAFKYQDSSKKNPYVFVSITADKKEIKIRIEDNGEGIAQQNQQKIFDMFYRASETSDGSGLGLYIVKNVVDTLKGRIYMTSVEKEGTTFEVILPNNK